MYDEVFGLITAFRNLFDLDVEITEVKILKH